MMRSFISLGLIVAGPTLFLSSADGASFHRNSLSFSALSDKSTFFGLSKTVSKWPRGGAEAEAEEPEAEVLYLPGLLDVDIVKSSQVRYLRNIARRFFFCIF
jgi:hypothetical protein